MEHKIILEFKVCLGEEQENMLIKQFQLLIGGTKKKLQGMKGLFQSRIYKAMTGGQSLMFAERVGIILDNWNEAIVLRRTTSSTYEFVFSEAYFKVFDFKVALPGNIKMETDYWSKLKRKIPKLLNEKTFPKMGLKKEDCTITTVE
jgi:hypothetical protein